MGCYQSVAITHVSYEALLTNDAVICFAFVQYWWQMIPLRMVLGIFEAGLFPGGAYLLLVQASSTDEVGANVVPVLAGTHVMSFKSETPCSI